MVDESPIETVSALVDALGGNQGVASICGVTSAAVSNWRAAKTLPVRVHWLLKQAADSRKLKVSPLLFEYRPLTMNRAGVA